jgi:ABC-2 type transport system permease protein
MVLTFLPSFLLSGFVYPIANMAKPVQWISYLVPARYFVALMRAIYLKGTGLEMLAGQAGLLVAFGAVMLVLANGKFKKKLA